MESRTAELKKRAAKSAGARDHRGSSAKIPIKMLTTVNKACDRESILSTNGFKLLSRIQAKDLYFHLISS